MIDGVLIRSCPLQVTGVQTATAFKARKELCTTSRLGSFMLAAAASALEPSFSPFAQKRSAHSQRRSQAAARTRVGAVEEDGQEANRGRARQQAQEDEGKSCGLATRRSHAHLHRPALRLKGGCLGEGSSLSLWGGAAKRLRGNEALDRQQDIHGASHHSRHQQTGTALCHGRFDQEGAAAKVS